MIGKSTMLSAIGQRELPIPDHIDIFHLTEEYPATDKSALDAVAEVRKEIAYLESRADTDNAKISSVLGGRCSINKPSQYHIIIADSTVTMIL